MDKSNASRISIAFSYDSAYPWHVGGIEKINMLESSALSKKYDVYFYTLRWPGMQRNFKKYGVKYDAIFSASQESLYMHRRRSIRMAILYSLSLFRLFRKKFDLVVVDAFPYLHLPVVMLYKKLFRVKVAIRVAEVWDYNYWKRYLGNFSGRIAYFLSRALIKGADAYIANTTTTKELLHKLGGIENSKILVFAPVIEEDAIKAAKRKSGNCKKAQIIFAGRLIKEKRIDMWLHVVKRVTESIPRATGIIIGDGPEKDNIESAIKELGLENKVRIEKPMPRSRLYREICCSSVLLNTSAREGLSMITLESMALGTLVVIPSDSPIPNDIRRLCITAEPDELHAKILKIIKNGAPKSQKNTESLKAFSTSNIIPFYSGLMKKLGIEGDS